jgi:hypothetical protein
MAFGSVVDCSTITIITQRDQEEECKKWQILAA